MSENEGELSEVVSEDEIEAEDQAEQEAAPFEEDPITQGDDASTDEGDLPIDTTPAEGDADAEHDGEADEDAAV